MRSRGECALSTPQGFNALAHAVGPVWHGYAEGSLDESLVEYRICRTHDPARELVRVAGTDIAGGMAGGLGYKLGEIIPAAHAFIGEMVHTRVLLVGT